LAEFCPQIKKLFMTTEMQTDSQAELSNIEMMIGRYVKAIDTNNIESVEQHLHSDFRAMVGADTAPGECKIISRASYLNLLATGKIGGEQREVAVQFVHINGANAIAFVRIENEQRLFLTYYNLIKKQGEWQLISDMPKLKAK
jgi:hypothetical protein